jgi:hypothetical protein
MPRKTLKAGPELDAAVAKAVFGTAEPNPPPYSTSIEAAWTVVERLVKLTPQHDLHIETLEGMGWSVSTCYDRDEGGWDQDSWKTEKTLPLAVCAAALQAAEAHPEISRRRGRRSVA